MGRNTKKLGNQLDEEFNKYLDAIGLGHIDKNETQIIERRRAFFAGASIMYDQFVDKVSEIETEDKALEYVQDLGKQLENFVAGVEIGER